MTFSYSGDPSSSVVDEIRFYLQDTRDENHVLEDEEILFYNDKLDTTFGAPIATAAYLADIVSNRFASELNISGDGVSISAAELQAKYKLIATTLRDQWSATQFGGPDIGYVDYYQTFDPSIKPLSVGIGFTDNRAAGNQNYGYQLPLWPEDYWLT